MAPARADQPKSDAVLSSRILEIGRLGRVERGATSKLHDLAVDQPSQSHEKIGQGERGGRKGSIESVGEEQITRENADRVAPDLARRRKSATLGAVVDDIVVQEGRRMHQLGHHRQLARRLGNRSEARRR